MFSIRLKMIFMVVFITIASFVTVMLSNIEIIRRDKEDSLKVSNRQISELVSRFVINQMTEYQRGLSYAFRAWSSNPDFQVEAEFFPDYVWFQILDWSGESVFEWQHEELLASRSLNPNRLLGKRNRHTLFSEMRQVLSRSNDWLLFNSTVDPLLPTFLLASIVGETDSGQAHIVLAEIHAEPLYRQVHPRRGQTMFLIDSHQNILLSTEPGWDPSKIVVSDQTVLSHIKSMAVNEEKLLTLEYPNKEAQLSFIHKFRAGNGLAILLQEPASNISKGQWDVQMQSAFVAFIVLILTINLIILFSHRITSPLKKLMGLMQKAGRGEFGGRIEVRSNDEIGKMAKVFNKMLENLREREQEVERAKLKLIQSEKMSAFGQMSAGIAHEVKNPLAGILGYAQMAKKKLEDRPEVLNYMEIIEKETTRCKEIVENLMRFARQEKANLQKVDLNKTVQDAVRLVEHQITVSGIKINQAYASNGAPLWIRGSSNQIQQVMLNLMLNAQHAMDGKGTLSISTHVDTAQSRCMIVIADTGQGMSEEVQRRIFEPFYTTKGVGKGTGLGLSVSLGIIKDHQGVIEVDSTEGKGTTFTIYIPIYSESEESAENPKVEESAGAA